MKLTDMKIGKRYRIIHSSSYIFNVGEIIELIKIDNCQYLTDDESEHDCSNCMGEATIKTSRNDFNKNFLYCLVYGEDIDIEPINNNWKARLINDG